MNEEWRLVTSSKACQDYVVFVDSKALEGAARRSIYAKCKLGAHHPERLLKQWPPDRLIDFRPAVYSAIFTVSNVNDS